MSKHIVLPDERAAQLLEIAETHKVSVAEAVGLLISWAIESGKVAPGIPGIDVSREDDLIIVDFGSFKRVMPIDLAKAFATCLRWFANTKGNGPQLAARDVSQLFSSASIVGLSKRGTSIKIAGDNGGERTLAFSVARELAIIIDSVAAA
jgi:hypothetical protein